MLKLIAYPLIAFWMVVFHQFICALMKVGQIGEWVASGRMKMGLRLRRSVQLKQIYSTK